METFFMSYFKTSLCFVYLLCVSCVSSIFVLFETWCQSCSVSPNKSQLMVSLPDLSIHARIICILLKSITIAWVAKFSVEKKLKLEKQKV